MVTASDYQFFDIDELNTKHNDFDKYACAARICLINLLQDMSQGVDKNGNLINVNFSKDQSSKLEIFNKFNSNTEKKLRTESTRQIIAKQQETKTWNFIARNTNLTDKVREIVKALQSVLEKDSEVKFILTKESIVELLLALSDYMTTFCT